MPTQTVPIPAIEPGYTRLHITPLDPDLLGVVLSSAVRSEARNISFHGLQTFSEKRYGFVELPSVVAEKLRKKLNGATLRGVKLRIEPARPKKREENLCFRDVGETGDDSDMPTIKEGTDAGEAQRAKGHRKDKSSSGRKKSKTSSRPGSEEITGIQLEPGRQVKRGWTEDPSEDRRARKQARKERKDRDKDGSLKKEQRHKAAKYSEKKECLVKTILPAKAAAAAALAAGATSGAATTAGGDAEDDEARARRKKKSKRARQIIVHEFEHSTKFPTFLKSSTATGGSARANLEYVTGKGWVNEEGEVVEALQSTRPAMVTAKIETEAFRAKIQKVRQAAKQEGSQGDLDASDTSDSDDSDSSDSSSEGEQGEDDENMAEEKAKGNQSSSDSESSSSDSDSDSDSDSSSGGSSDEKEAAPMETEILPSSSPTTERPKSGGSAKALTIKIPPPASAALKEAAAVNAAAKAATGGMPPATPVKTPHPLEMLYKKNKDETAVEGETTKLGFSFFGAPGGDEEMMDLDEAELALQREEASFGVQQPMTPFTREELEWRHVRSAAPTPDTAHPSRMSTIQWPLGGSDEGEDDEAGDEDGEEADKDMEDMDGIGATEEAGDGSKKDDPTTNFEGWFWENRGDLNRSWKRRRKMAAKEKRYRENKARSGRTM